MAQAANKLVSRIPGMISGVVQYSTPRLKTAWRYIKVEFKPPTASEIPEITKRFNSVLYSARTGKFTQLSVKQAWLNSLVALELIILFFVGEVIGRGTLVGYDVSRVQPNFPLW